MSKCCEDSCCEDIFRKIERPDTFVLGRDTNLFKTYYKPVGSFKDVLPKLYYDDKVEMLSDYTNYFISNPPVRIKVERYASSSFYRSVDSAIELIDDFFVGVIETTLELETTIYYAFWVEFSVYNINFGKWNSDPSFLRYDYDGWRSLTPSQYRNPTWLLSFPSCGSNNNSFSQNKVFDLKGCDTWEISYRLRIKPLLFLSRLDPTAPSDPCTPFVSLGYQNSFREGYPYTYSDYSSYVEMINFLETKQGSRWLGLTPLRIETGLYNYDTFTFTPIVDSQGSYPQIVPGHNHLLWKKIYQDKLLCKNSDGIVEMTNTHLGPNSSSDVVEYIDVSPTPNDIVYYFYGGVGTYSPNAGFTTQVDSINNPGTFKINKYSLKVKELDGVVSTGRYENSLFNYISDFISPPTKVAGLYLSLEYNINGEWKEVLGQDYGVTYLDIEGEQLLVGTNPNGSIYYIDEDYITSTPTSFNIATGYDYRWSFKINFSKIIKKIDTFGTYEVKLQNYTRLTEEFTIELNGFTNVDLDNGNVGIYVKVLPDTDNTHNVGMYDKTSLPQIFGFDMILNEGLTYTDALCDKVILPDPCYPWGELGIGSNNGWVKQPDVQYYPLLPINRRVYTQAMIDYPTMVDYEIETFPYRFGLIPNTNAPALYLMIEEGWVSAKPVCEKC
jgi:hypothetical protein